MLSSQKQARAIRIHSLTGIHQSVKPFLWRKELKELLSSKILNMAWWPVLKLRQRYFTHSPLLTYCKTLPGFKNLWNTIQKGSFAYNCLFLGIRPYHRSYSSTDLADVTTLALFFGDEFIDGVCKAAGKSRMRELLNNNPGRFRLKKKITGQQVRLVYRFDLNKLLPAFVMEQVTPKYGISYAKFYYLLEHFLQLMNDYIAELPFAKAQLAADKIIDVCNTCLESYLHDINSEPLGDQIHEVSEVLHFHEMKTRYMQEKFLELRCILTDKEHMMDSQQKQGWLDIMRVVQIYDDLQDITEDDGFQDNLVISVAFHQFREEWEWFKTNQHLTRLNQRPFLLSVYMPQTINYCLELASARMQTMNWEQQKIMNYLLFKNWFIAQDEKGIENSFSKFSSDKVFLKNCLSQLQFLMPDTNDEEIKAHLINSCFHLKSTKKMLYKKLGWATYYQLRYNLLNVSSKIKERAFNKLISSVPRGNV